MTIILYIYNVHMNGIVTTTTLRNNLADVLAEVAKRSDYLLVTKKQNPVSALVNLDFFEDLLALANPKYLKSIKLARDQYKKGKTSSFDEVFGQL